VASEQIGSDRHKQPKPNNENKYCERIYQEISIGEASLKENIANLPVLS